LHPYVRLIIFNLKNDWAQTIHKHFWVILKFPFFRCQNDETESYPGQPNSAKCKPGFLRDEKECKIL